MTRELSTTAHERLRNQRLAGPKLSEPRQVVRWLVASQAQDFAGAKWAIGLRMRDTNDAAVELEVDAGRILRTHVLRPTWHFVDPEDIRWLLMLTAPRIIAMSAGRYRELGLDARTLRRAVDALAKTLSGGNQLTRDELRQVLARARIATDDQRMTYILMRAELEAVIVNGARRGKQFTYAALDERAPRGRVLSRAEALVELVERYFVSRGPATVQDFAKWSGLTIADGRAGIDALASRLHRRVIAGVTYWSGEPVRGRRRGVTAHLLSIFDELISSYRDRRATCAPQYAKRLTGAGNALGYVILVDGQIVGTWKRELGRSAVTVRPAPFRPLVAAEQRAIELAARRFARFVGRDYELRLLW